MIKCLRQPARNRSRAGRAVCVVLVAVLAYGAHALQPPAADAATTCSGSPQPAPETMQFGSCKGLLPFPVFAKFLGSLLRLAQLPIPQAMHAQLQEILGRGEKYVFSEWFGMHTVFWQPWVVPPCSFGDPGENRFVGDKFVFDGFMDFPVPFFGYTAGLVPVNRYVGPVMDPNMESDLTTGNLIDPGGAISSGTIGPNAHVRALVYYGIMAWILDAEFGFIKVNNQPVWIDLIPGDFGFQVIEGDIGIEHLRFPGRTANGYCPWPAANKVVVWIPSTISWMDWAEFTIESTPPVVFIPGDQSTSLSAPLYSLPCRSLKFGKALARILPFGEFGAEVAGSLVPYDLCATAARRGFSEFLDTVESEGRIAKTTDDMVQVPSRFNSDPAGWLMCDEAAGGSWVPNAPLAYYLGGVAKSLGVGTIDVIAHSKGGVDLLHFMTSDWYGDAYDADGLYIRNVATLGAPFYGSPLAAGYLQGGGGQPVPLGRQGTGMPVTLATNFWNGFWDNFFDIASLEIRTAAQQALNGSYNILTYVMNLGLTLACNQLTQLGAGAVRVEQDPEVESRLTRAQLASGFRGERPNWITFGANADQGGDDDINQTCTGFSAFVWRTLLGDTRRRNCVPSSDDIELSFAPLTYLIIGTYYCDSWNGANGACDAWTSFRHNDGVVDVLSARLGAGYDHTVLDKYTVHMGHSLSNSIINYPANIMSMHADHTMLRSTRASSIWPVIKSKWGANTPTTQYQ